MRGDDEISESHLENRKYLWDQEELDRDIEEDQGMQMFNMQNSFKPGMLLKQQSLQEAFGNMRKSTSRKNTEKNGTAQDSQSNFMSKMSKLDSGLGTSYGGLSGSKISSRLSAQSK